MGALRGRGHGPGNEDCTSQGGVKRGLIDGRQTLVHLQGKRSRLCISLFCNLAPAAGPQPGPSGAQSRPFKLLGEGGITEL